MVVMSSIPIPPVLAYNVEETIDEIHLTKIPETWHPFIIDIVDGTVFFKAINFLDVPIDVAEINNFQTHRRFSEVPNSRRIEYDYEMALTYDPFIVELNPTKEYYNKRIFSETERTIPVIEKEIPVEILEDSRFDIRATGEFQFGELNFSPIIPTHLENSSNIFEIIRIEESGIALGSLTDETHQPLESVPLVGSIVWYEGKRWQIIHTDVHQMYDGNEDGAQDWIGSWTTARNTALGWGQLESVLNPGTFLASNANISANGNGNWWSNDK